MKKIIKILIETFLKFVVYILVKINLGRYILDELNKNIIKKKEIIIYKDLKLIFYVPNRLSHYRVNTFHTKEPETLEWIDTFKKKVYFGIWGQILDYIVATQSNVPIVKFMHLNRRYSI